VVSNEKQKCDGVPARDGGFVMLVRSGTACRAPTAETAEAKRTMSLYPAKQRDRAAAMTLAQAGLPVLLEAGGTNGDGAKDLTSKEVRYMNGKRRRRRRDALRTSGQAGGTKSDCRTEAEQNAKRGLGVSFSTATVRF
jgi:hypothetical protein